MFLSTAKVLIKDKFGNFKECRCLLDSGSQSNFISQELCDRLGVEKERTNIPVLGINQTGTKVQNMVHCTLKSRFNGFTVHTTFLVLNKITEWFLVFFVKNDSLGIPENLSLADDSFDVPGKIDLPLGATVFWDLLCVG